MKVVVYVPADRWRRLVELEAEPAKFVREWALKAVDAKLAQGAPS